MIRRDPARRALLSIRCPHCRCAAGQRCVLPTSGQPLASGAFHQARQDAARVAAPRGAA